MNKSIKHIDLQPNKTASAFSLIEMLVVVTIVALLIGLAIPAMNMMQKSYDSTGTESMIASALSTARALAISHQKYAGVRFQKEWTSDPNKADQYMIFIIYEEPKKMGNLTIGFRAIEGYKPMKLPSNTGVMDMSKNVNFDNNRELIDGTTFSIIFSPSGKLVTHQVRVRNKDGIPDTVARRGDTSLDDVFNKKGDVDKSTPALVAMGMGKEIGKFYQDDYYGDTNLDTPAYPDLNDPHPNLGLGPESSGNKFVIYDCEKLSKQSEGIHYLKTLKESYINAYTGEIIK